jgi:protein-S-isoprenylcysteine O-methyltransferase Ste14
VVLAVCLLSFASFILNHHSVFHDQWFPSQFTSSAFMFLFYAWILSEFINNIWSWKNSQKTNKDKGSYLIVVAPSIVAMIIVFVLRSFEVGVFNGSLQYIGLILIVFGIVLREWSIWVLGKHFTVQVQIREKAKLVTQGPYKYIRHPAYTGSLLSFTGVPLAIGTWSGAVIAVIVCWTVHLYRIRVEEEALQEAFDSEYEEYKKKTWKLFPGF